jgi:hypothetical protein
MTLLIVTHVLHKKQAGQLFAYGPYVREMNLWGKHARQLLILAPATDAEPTPLICPTSIPPFDSCRFRSWISAISLQKLDPQPSCLWCCGGCFRPCVRPIMYMCVVRVTLVYWAVWCKSCFQENEKRPNMPAIGTGTVFNPGVIGCNKGFCAIPASPET